MCGRYVMAKATSDLVAGFGITETVGEEPGPSWNVAPTDNVRIVTERHRHDIEPRRQLATAKWGLVPAWAKDPKIGSRMINARVETILEKPAFRKAALKHRALVPGEGYYEWQKTADGKIPTYLHAADDSLIAFAGLYEFWPDPTLPEDDPNKWLMSCTIITTTATDALGHIHDRTPLIVPPDLYDDWLAVETLERQDVQQLLDAMPEPVLVPRVVSGRVNSVRNNGPELIEPAEPPVQGTLLG